LEIYSHRKPKSNPCWALGLSQTEIQEDDVKGSQLNSARKAARIARANRELFFLLDLGDIIISLAEFLEASGRNTDQIDVLS
jgi:uncharacterized membrane protein YccC